MAPENYRITLPRVQDARIPITAVAVAPRVWTGRTTFAQFCASAFRMSQAVLDAAETPDDGDPVELAQDYLDLLSLRPNLRDFGACCGADHPHIRDFGRNCSLETIT